MIITDNFSCFLMILPLSAGPPLPPFVSSSATHSIPLRPARSSAAIRSLPRCGIVRMADDPAPAGFEWGFSTGDDVEQKAASAKAAAPAKEAAPAKSGAVSKVPEGMIKLSGGLRPANELNVAVFGGGSFGTAMACVLGRKGIKATLVVRRAEVVEQINANHTNPYYQSDLLLPESVYATLDPQEAFANADFIFHAVPMQYSRAALEKVSHLIRDDVPVVSLAKGIETSTLCLMSEVIPQCLGEDQPVAFVSGPSFAKEIVQGMATAVTVASTDRALANDLMALFTSSSFRALYTPDVQGVEIGGAVKNVIAIAAGMSEGLGLGTNAMAALVTRGCGEMRRLGEKRGGGESEEHPGSEEHPTAATCGSPAAAPLPHSCSCSCSHRAACSPPAHDACRLFRLSPLPRSSLPRLPLPRLPPILAVTALDGESSTVFGLSGVGDTFGTCFGPLSRNRQVGYIGWRSRCCSLHRAALSIVLLSHHTHSAGCHPLLTVAGRL